MSDRRPRCACGDPLPPGATGSGRPYKHCSDRCRQTKRRVLRRCDEQEALLIQFVIDVMQVLMKPKTTKSR